MELHNLRFGYRRRCPVVQDVSAQIEPGKIHALIGPNAAGKSTLIRLMLDELRPWSGSVRLGGTGITKLSAAQRAAWISYVPQRAAAAFAFPVRHVVAMGRFALPGDSAAVDEAMELCDLAAVADRPFTELSVGQQQRVLLARAMAQAAGGGRIMLLDEPTSAMDLAHVHQTMHLLRRMAGRGLAVVTVVQDINLAARYADRVWLLSEGRLAAQGAWEDVLRPELLEAVYGVSIRSLRAEGRPVFEAELLVGELER